MKKLFLCVSVAKRGNHSGTIPQGLLQVLSRLFGRSS